MPLRSTLGRVLIALLLASGFSFAQFVSEISSAELQRVKEVRVYGLQGASEDLIIRHLGVKPGEMVRPALLSEKVGMAIRSLWETKLFADVRVDVEYSEGGEELVLIVQVEEQPTLGSVEIVGNSGVAESDLEALVQLSPGQVFGQGDVERIRQRFLRKYREEGYLLAEVQPVQTIDFDDGRTMLTFRIREGRKVTVAEIRINGNTQAKRDEIVSALASSVDHWWSSGEFKEEQLLADEDSIRTYYRTQGFLDAEVTGHRVISRVDSTFHFYIGRLAPTPAETDSILYRLERELKTGGLLAKIATEAAHNDNPYFRRFRSTTGAVPSLRIESEEEAVDLLNRLLDLSSLRKTWLNRIDAEAGRSPDFAARKKLGSNGERLLVRRDLERRYGLLSFQEARTGHEVELEFDVVEGRRYYTGNFTFAGNDIYPTPVLQNRMRLDSGKAFNYSLFEQSLQEIYGIYREEGYLFVQVEEHKIYRDSLVDVEFKITEGKPASIHSVLIEGNTTTKDKVIRREIRLFPGDTYRQSLMERSFRDIMQLNYFDNVLPDIRMRPESEQEVDLIFKVKEREAGTGQFTAGLAYSQKDYLTGTLGLSIPNCCLGDGQVANVAVEYGEYRKNYSIGFSEPWFRDQPTRVGGTVSYYSYSYDDRDISDITRYGVRGYVGRRLKWPDDYFYVQADAQIMRHEQGKNFSDDALVLYTGHETSLSATIIRDDKDLPIFPTEGSRLSVRGQWAIPPGDFSFFETEITAKWWWPLLGRLVLGFDGALGVINGEQVQYSSLYQMGGMLGYQGKLRGYSAGSIGRYRIGRSYLSLSAEFSYGIVPQVFYAIAFANAGNVYGPHLNTEAIPTKDDLASPWAEIDPSDLYKDIGFGFRVQVPMLGIIGFDWGWPLDPSELSNGKQGTEVGDYRVNFIISQGF